jgi:hypothetical protein
MHEKKLKQMTRLQQDQLGLVAVDQMRDLDLSRSAIRWQVKSGRLVKVGRSVFSSPTAARPFDFKILAAILHASDGAFASHESALELWNLPLPSAAAIEVTTALGHRPRTAGVRWHRTGHYEAADVTRLRQLAISTPERSIVDVSGRFSAPVLGKLIDEALRRRLVTTTRLRLAVQRLAPAPGRSAKKMSALLDRRDDLVGLRESILEDFVFTAISRFGLPLPVVQYHVFVGGRDRYIDQCYPDEALALEAAGFDTHRMRSRFDDDALRGNELQLAGFRVLEFTSAFDDWAIATQVARALSLPRPSRPARVLTFEQWKAERDCLD